MDGHNAELDSETDYGHHKSVDIKPHGLEPSYASFTSIPHYYGDVVRDLLLGATALMLITSPLYADMLRTQFILLIPAAVCMIAAAAFTDPHRRSSIIADAAISGAGLVIFAGWTLMNYDSITLLQAMLRLAIALVLLFAFYFSLKTVRAFALHEVGREDAPGKLT